MIKDLKIIKIIRIFNNLKKEISLW